MDDDAGRIIDAAFMRGDRTVGEDMLRSGARSSKSEPSESSDIIAGTTFDFSKNKN